MSYVKGLGTTAIEYGLGPGWTPPPPPPQKIAVTRATPAMAARSRRAVGDISTDQAVSIVQSEGAATDLIPSMPSWAWFVILGGVAYYLTRDTRGYHEGGPPAKHSRQTRKSLERLRKAGL